MLLAWASLGASLSWGGRGHLGHLCGVGEVGFAPKNGDRAGSPRVVPWGRKDVVEDGSRLQGLISCPDEETCNHLK